MLFWLLQFQYVARSMWVHPLNNLRFEKGEFYTHYLDLRHFLAKFFSMHRMNVAKFDNLLLRVASHIAPKRTNCRHCISAEQKLVITLRYGIPIHIIKTTNISGLIVKNQRLITLNQYTMSTFQTQFYHHSCTQHHFLDIL